MKFKEKYSRWCTTCEKIETQLKQSYFKYYGQCDDDMKASLEEDAGFTDAHKTKDVLKLRIIIRTVVTFHYRKSKEPIKMMFESNKDFLNFKQHRMNVTEYYKKFCDLKNLVIEMGGDKYGCYNPSGLAEVVCREAGENIALLSPDEKKGRLEKGHERMMAMHFLKNSDMERYGDILDEYDRDYLGGVNKHPSNLHDAQLPAQELDEGEKSQKMKVPGKLGLTFNTLGEGEEDEDKDEDGVALTNDGIRRRSAPAADGTTTLSSSAWPVATWTGPYFILWGKLAWTMPT